MGSMKRDGLILNKEIPGPGAYNISPARGEIK